MNNLSTKNVSVTETERKTLLREFEDVAWDLKKYSVFREIILSNLSGWISLKMTALMQTIGYNRRKLRAFEGKKIILNIGCLKVTNSSYVNGDLFPSVEDIFQIITGKSKIEYDLFINLTSYDSNLSVVSDGIILSHVLEHITPGLAITALKNCFAYLKPNGYIRISVPYLGAYDQPNMPNCQKFENRMLAKNKLIYDYGHQFMYDAELLTVLMEHAGFSQVKEVTFEEGILGETDLPDRQPESIYLTGIKKTHL